MLQSIRDKSQTVFVWAIVFLLVATFVFWGIHTYTEANKTDDTVAWVDKQPITQKAWHAFYQRLRQQQQIQLGANFSLSPTAAHLLRQQALNELVLSQALINAAKKAGYRVTLDQVNRALLQIPAFQENGNFSKSRFSDILNSLLYTQEQFLDDMRYSMLINQVQGGYVNSAFTLPSEVDTAIRLVNQRRDIRYVIIPSGRFGKQIHVLPEAIKAYYQKNASAFQSPEQVSMDYILLSLPEIQSRLSFDKTKLQQYYELNIQHYTRPARWHIAAIFLKVPPNASSQTMKNTQAQAYALYSHLKKGEDFSTLARRYSQDAVSAKKGGVLPWFNAGTLDPALEKAVETLKKPGEVSLPVQTATGVSLIKLLGYQKAEVLSFESVKSQIEKILAQQHAEQIFLEKSDKLSNLAYANPDSLDIPAKALNLEIKTTGLFSREGTKLGLTANPRVVAAAFSNDVLIHGNNSDLLQIDPNTAMVLRLRQHKPAALLPLSAVQTVIETKLRNQAAQAKAAAFAQGLMHQIIPDKKNGLFHWAKRYQLPFQEDKNAGRFDAKIDSFILNQAFKMPVPSSQTPSIKSVALPSGDYAIISIDAVHEGGQQGDNGIQQHVFEEEMESNWGRLDYQFYVTSVIKKAHIKRLPEALDKKNPDDATSENADGT